MTTEEMSTQRTRESNADPARVYDYFIGGESGFDADRAAGAWINFQAPDLLAAMRANRAFLARAVRWLTEQGVDQFIDIGSGFPLSPNTHETVLSAFPSGSVVYCDVDAAVGERTRELVAGQPGATFVQGDIRDPERLLAQPAVRALVDSGRPVACVLAAVLHFVPEEADPARITAVLRDALPPGSYLVVSHVAGDIPWDDRNSTEALRRATEEMYPRTRSQFTTFFGDFDLVEPGVGPAPRWHRADGAADENPDLPIYAGVARKAL
ncbi:SAM-dependent methyltransferase [Micromonospora sp. NPDC048898]|uniref:SAM-dependent methyltransferase n=1 Tax=Micromonospora sp. NPDC048898 TaxID=3364260 RepID=UPI003716FB12